MENTDLKFKILKMLTKKLFKSLFGVQHFCVCFTKEIFFWLGWGEGGGGGGREVGVCK